MVGPGKDVLKVARRMFNDELYVPNVGPTKSRVLFTGPPSQRSQSLTEKFEALGLTVTSESIKYAGNLLCPTDREEQDVKMYVREELVSIYNVLELIEKRYFSTQESLHLIKLLGPAKLNHLLRTSTLASLHELLI